MYALSLVLRYGLPTVIFLAIVASCGTPDNLVSDGDRDPPHTPSGDGPGGDADPGLPDTDGDGTPDPWDCAPEDPDVAPGLPERCGDRKDNDCNGVADESCADTHCGNVTVDTVWGAGEVHFVGCSVYVQGPAAPTLTIAGGAQVVFAPGAGLFVGNSQPGGLVVEGTAAPVIFGPAEEPEPGSWVGIHLGRYTLEGTALRGASIENAGGDPLRTAGLWLSSTPLVHLEDVVVRGSAGAGIVLELESVAVLRGSSLIDNATVGLVVGPFAGLAGFSDNLVSGNGVAPMLIPVTDVARLDEGSIFIGNGNDEIRVRGGYLTESAAWPALDVPLVILGEVYVESSGVTPAVLTLPEGAELRFAYDVGLKVGYSGPGELVAIGGEREIVFDSASGEGPGSWPGLFLGDLSTSATVLERVVVRAAGGGGRASSIYAYYANPVVRSSIIEDGRGVGIRARCSVPTMTDTTITGMVPGAGPDDGGDGVRLEGPDAGLVEWRDNVVTGNAGVPVVVPPHAVHHLDIGSTYTGNGQDAVWVTGGVLGGSVWWMGLPVPWVLTGTLYVQGTSSRAILHISDGVLAVARGVTLRVGVEGAGDLELRRTLVTASGDAPEPGAWRGIRFGTETSSASLIDASEVAFGGNAAQPELSGNVTLAPGTSVRVTGTLLRDSAGWGLFCEGGCGNHLGTLAGNSFENNAAGDKNP